MELEVASAAGSPAALASKPECGIDLKVEAPSPEPDCGDDCSLKGPLLEEPDRGLKVMLEVSEPDRRCKGTDEVAPALLTLPEPDRVIFLFEVAAIDPPLSVLPPLLSLGSSSSSSDTTTTS